LDSAEHKKTFTFLTEKEGSTIIEQFEGRDVTEATLNWFHGSETKPGKLLEGDEPTPINDVTNVWCISGIDNQGVFFLVHVVRTAV